MGTMRVDEASLVATADAIRGKTGESNLIEWVKDKGFADAVAGIQAGGGVETITSNINIAEDGNVIEFSHGLGFVPGNILLMINPGNTLETGMTIAVFSNDSGGLRMVNGSGSGSNSLSVKVYMYIAAWGINAGEHVTADLNNVTITVPSATMKFFAGTNYTIVCSK